MDDHTILARWRAGDRIADIDADSGLGVYKIRQVIAANIPPEDRRKGRRHGKAAPVVRVARAAEPRWFSSRVGEYGRQRVLAFLARLDRENQEVGWG